MHAPPTALVSTDNQRKQRKDNSKECPEIKLSKQQRVLRIKSEYVV